MYSDYISVKVRQTSINLLSADPGIDFWLFSLNDSFLVFANSLFYISFFSACASVHMRALEPNDIENCTAFYERLDEFFDW